MNERLHNKLQRLVNNRFAVPQEFWLKTQDVEFRNRNQRTQNRNAPPVPAEFETVWIVLDEVGRNRNNRSRTMFEQHEKLPPPFTDVRRCFVRIGMEKVRGAIVWGYRYSMAMEPPTNVYHCFDSTEKYAEIAKSSGPVGFDWQSEAEASVDEWLLVIDAASGKEVDPTKILEVRNMEMRRYLIKKIGYAEIKKRLPGFKSIGKVDSKGYELFEITMPENQQNDDGRRLRDRVMRFIKVVDASTDREYILSVPPTTASVHEGLAWGFGFTKAEMYKPLAET